MWWLIKTAHNNISITKKCHGCVVDSRRDHRTFIPAVQIFSTASNGSFSSIQIHVFVKCSFSWQCRHYFPFCRASNLWEGSTTVVESVCILLYWMNRWTVLTSCFSTTITDVFRCLCERFYDFDLSYVDWNISKCSWTARTRLSVFVALNSKAAQVSHKPQPVISIQALHVAQAPTP